ncbi:MAG: DnaA regulatory inactivator Hda [Francisellaceae bacterium]|nr:DnaA regulatory inactivator Hda [Francisellaceae bacterium]
MLESLNKQKISSNQLSLAIQSKDDSTLNSFYIGENQVLYHDLINTIEGVGESFLYIWGKSSSGRTHLLQAACLRGNEKGLKTIFLPLKEMIHLEPSVLVGLEYLDLVCIDDIDAVIEKPEWQEAIFHLFNRLIEGKKRLIISALSSPLSLALELLDLKSRLAGGITYHIEPLKDEDKLDALRLRASCRGLTLSRACGEFLLKRCARSMHELFHTLEILDKASLVAQHRLTIPFVKKVLEI